MFHSSRPLSCTLALLTLLLIPLTAQAQFTYPDFNDVTGLTLNGSAQQLAPVLRLTEENLNTETGFCESPPVGTVFFNTAQAVGTRFETTFTLQISNAAGQEGGGDGLTFTVQNNDATAFGNGGGGLGYETVANSVTVEFDSFDNTPITPTLTNEPNDNHVGVSLQGSIDSEITYNLDDFPADLKAGAVHTARIVYGEGVLDVYFDGTLILSYPVDLSTELGGNTGFVGFTSGVAGACADHDILSWSFDADDDNDNVLNSADLCPGTVIPENVPTVQLGVNHFALVNDDFTFDTVAPMGTGPGAAFTTTDTHGCSCEQIIAAEGLGLGHEKFGCSIEVMSDWVAGAASASTRAPRASFDVASAQAPDRVLLEGNYPNPFNPTTTIRYGLPETTPVRLAVYDVMGREVSVLVAATQAAGMHEARFEAVDLPSGLYLYRLDTPSVSLVGKMQVLK